MTLSDRNHSDSSRKWRILIVENDPKQRVNLTDLLGGWGYQVVEVETQEDAQDHYQALLADALRKSYEHQFHILLVDMRLESDEDRRDCTGAILAMELISRNPLLRVIIRSSYPRPVSLEDWQYIGKGDGAEALKEIIEKTLASLPELPPEGES